MTVSQGIFSDVSNFNLRFVSDYSRLSEMAQSLRDLGTTVVLTSGSFDMVHEGHALYLEKARSFGDFLIVGVDSDDKIKARKGPDRPIVPEQERLRMLTHFRAVDVVTLKPPGIEQWALIKAVNPDVLVATVDTYSDEDIARLEAAYCKKVEVLARQATTTTTARIRLLQFGLADRVSAQLIEVLGRELPKVVQSTINKAVGRNE